MRILFISAYAPIPNTHAGGQRVLRMIAGLSKFHEITLLTFIDEEDERDRLSHVGAFCKDVIPVLRTRYPNCYDPWGINPRWLEVEFNSDEMRKRIKDAAFSGQYDLLQFEFLQTSMLMPDYAPIPMVLTHHEVQSLSLQRKMRFTPPFSTERAGLAVSWMRMFHYEIKRLPRFNRVIVVTEEEKRYLTRYCPSMPVVVNTMGVDCSFFKPLNETEEPNSLAYVAYFKHEPNVDAAVWMVKEILPKVARSIPDIRLYLIGKDPPEKIRNMHNGMDIHVTGWVPDIRPFLGRCAVFSSPIRLGAGMRGKILEAWAMKRPIICTTVASAGLRAQHGENILIADDADSFADQICNLLSNTELRERIGSAGLETARTYYDWDILVRQQNKMYEDMQ